MSWQIIGPILFLSIVAVYYLHRLKRLEQKPNSIYNKKVTKFGYVMFSIMTVVMIGILSLEYTAPNSEIGKLVSTEGGSFLFFAVAVVFAIVSRFFRKYGLKLLENKKEDV